MKNRYVKSFYDDTLSDLENSINRYAKFVNANIIQISYSSSNDMFAKEKALVIFEE